MPVVEKRAWRVNSDDGTHVVELDYRRWNGRGRLTVDGQILARIDPLATLGPARDHPFRLGGREAVLQPSIDGFAFDYDLVVDGRSVDTGLPSPLARRLRSRNWMAGVELLTGLAIVVVVSASWLALVELRYEGSGQIANGSIVNKREELRGTELGSYTEYRVEYRFSVSDGRVVDGDSQVDLVTYGQLEVGAPVRVQYLPDDPTRSRLQGFSGSVYTQWLGAAALAAGAAALVVLAIRLSRERIERRLAAEGLSASAVITAIERTWLPQAHSVIRYSYRDQEARERQGKSWTLRSVEVAAWRVGDRCRVHYNAKDSTVSLFVERLPRES
jgi:hypothetical protein